VDNNYDNYNYVDDIIIIIIIIINNGNLVLSFYCNIEIRDTESYDTRQNTSLQLSS